MRHTVRSIKYRREDFNRMLAGLPRAKCLTPHKVKYRTLKGAELAAERQWRHDQRIVRPYVCSDHFHLTSRGPV